MWGVGGRGGCRDFSVQGRRSLGCRVLEIFEGLETNGLVFRV